MSFIVDVRYEEPDPKTYRGIEIRGRDLTIVFGPKDPRQDMVDAVSWFHSNGITEWCNSSSVDHFLQDGGANIYGWVPIGTNRIVRQERKRVTWHSFLAGGYIDGKRFDAHVWYDAPSRRVRWALSTGNGFNVRRGSAKDLGVFATRDRMDKLLDELEAEGPVYYSEE